MEHPCGAGIPVRAHSPAHRPARLTGGAPRDFRGLEKTERESLVSPRLQKTANVSLRTSVPEGRPGALALAILETWEGRSIRDIPLPTRYPGIKDLQTSFAKPLIKRDFGEKAINGSRAPRVSRS